MRDGAFKKVSETLGTSKLALEPSNTGQHRVEKPFLLPFHGTQYTSDIPRMGILESSKDSLLGTTHNISGDAFLSSFMVADTDKWDPEKEERTE